MGLKKRQLNGLRRESRLALTCPQVLSCSEICTTGPEPMNKAFRNPLFLVGFALIICGSTFALNGLLTERTFLYMAPGLLIPGVTFMLTAWKQRNR